MNDSHLSASLLYYLLVLNVPFTGLDKRKWTEKEELVYSIKHAYCCDIWFYLRVTNLMILPNLTVAHHISVFLNVVHFFPVHILSQPSFVVFLI